MKYSFLICKNDELWKVPRVEWAEGNSEIEALTNIIWSFKDKIPSWYDSYLYVYSIRNGIIDSFQSEYESAVYKCLQREKLEKLEQKKNV